MVWYLFHIFVLIFSFQSIYIEAHSFQTILSLLRLWLWIWLWLCLCLCLCQCFCLCIGSSAYAHSYELGESESGSHTYNRTDQHIQAYKFSSSSLSSNVVSFSFVRLLATSPIRLLACSLIRFFGCSAVQQFGSQSLWVVYRAYICCRCV